MRELAAEGISVALTCRVLNIARQVYYRWLADPVTPAELEEAYRANALLDAHRDDPEFGYRYLHEEAAEAGQSMAARTAWRICSDNRWWSAFSKRRSKNGKRPGPPVHDDLVRRKFAASRPNELWLTDITEHWTAEGKLYLCAIKDMFSRRIVGYSIDSRMTSRLAVRALTNAVARRQVEGVSVAGCRVHSDRGSQGGFNRSSQHPRSRRCTTWSRPTGPRRPATSARACADSGVLIVPFGRPCAHRAGRSHRGWCSARSGD